MNVLITNDDGYGARGLETLKQKLLENNHRVFVMAPSGNRSGVSHGMTFGSLDFVKVRENEWTCSGKPVDCVVSALRSDIFPEKIDVVISGINAGANIGTDILYSGTCAAARQAVMYGIPGIALSIEPAEGTSYAPPSEELSKKYNFNGMADFAVKNLTNLINLCRLEDKYAFVNVNALSGEKYTEAAVCKNLAQRTYRDYVKLGEKDDRGIQKSEFSGDFPFTKPDEYSDHFAVYKKMVSVSVVYAEPAACEVDGISFSL